jgi:hypothetical protein
MKKGSGISGRWTDSFESDPAVIYALDRDDRLIHCNLAWDVFALENNGASAVRQYQLARSIFDSIPASLTAFYRSLYESVRAARQERTHIMECSSPLLLRRFHMSIRPFGESGVLTVNTLLEETSHGGRARSQKPVMWIETASSCSVRIAGERNAWTRLKSGTGFRDSWTATTVSATDYVSSASTTTTD